MEMNVSADAQRWVAQLLRNARAPERVRSDVERLKLNLLAHIGAHDLFTGRQLTKAGTLVHNCPTCGKPAEIDVSRVMCRTCGKPMVIRKNRLNGSSFLGCSGYPNCTFTRSMSAFMKEAAEELRKREVIQEEELRMIEV